LYTISVIVGCDGIIPVEEPSAERALPLKNGGMSASEKTSIIHVIDPVQGGSKATAETDLPRI
jgi:hypothetical protein